MKTALLAWACIANLAAAADLAFQVRLEDALLQQRTPTNTPVPKAIVLDLSRHGETWDDVWGVGMDFNQGEHRGTVERGTVAPDRIDAQVRMRITGDPWVPGGPACWTFALQRNGDRLEGSFEGTFRGLPVKGAASGMVLPPPAPPPPGFVPPQPGEHPRLLFRTNDLARLRAKAETPFGRLWVARMQSSTNDCVAMGMIHQLTGDPDWARRAQPLVDALIAKAGAAGPFNLPHPVGERLGAVALTFDLCYAAWPEDYRAKVLGYLIHYSERTILRPQYLSRKMSFSPSSNYQGAVRGGGALAGLAMWGEKGPEPAAPAAPTNATPEEAAALRLAWEEEHRAWESSGGLNQHALHMAKLGERQLQRYLRTCFGDGGWQAEGEGYTQMSCPPSLAAAHAYRTMWGRDATPQPDVELFAPRYVMQGIFPGDGKEPFAQSDSISDGTLQPRHYARVFGVTDPRYQPAVLWAWNQWLQLRDPAAAAVVEQDPELKALAASGSGGEDAVFTFVNYPLDLAPRAPGEVLPRTWQATTRGGYVFRNGWTGRDDVVAQVFLKSMPPGGWSAENAGTFRLYGLGHAWAVRSPRNPKAGVRRYENVLQLPDDPINAGVGAFMTDYRPQDDGSGTLAFSLDDVYSGRVAVTNLQGRAEPAALSTSEFVWLRHNMRDLGIHGGRAFAVDFSGRAGAPALLAVADRVTGGGRRVWAWQLPDSRVAPAVQTDASGFTLSYPDANLRATFVAPSPVTVACVSDKQTHAIQATGAGDTFFAVLTLQRGPAPTVTVADGAACVGTRRVTFDGTRIHLEDAPGGTAQAPLTPQ